MDTWLQVPPRGRVLVAMSGGVDSSVAAALMVERGCDVVGVTMKNFCYSEVPEEYTDAACCSLEAIEDARSVARQLGIPHHVLDFEGPFRGAVIDPFVAEYAAGRTPNPCDRCNRFVRFPGLWRKARLLGAVGVATGHYARATRVDGAVRLERPRDRRKDQTFYLWGLSAGLLDRALFPLAGLTKDEVRHKAEELGFDTARKPESQDICFIPDGDLRGFLERHRRSRADVAETRFEPGAIHDRSGAVVGSHPGSAFYTVGQRRGLGIAGCERPLFVTEIGSPNTLVVGEEDDLYGSGLYAEQINWIESPGARRVRAEIQIRYRGVATPGWIEALEGERARVRFDHPVRAIAPGQSVVFYDGDRVLGGGVIEERQTG